MPMHRHQLQDLQEWLKRPKRYALVVRGARQVGKSTLVEAFCESAGCELLTANLERHPDLAGIFSGNDPAAILNLLEARFNKRLSDRTVLFLDDVHAAPRAFASLRYFCEELPEQPVVAAGSLLEMMLSAQPVPMPVGRIEYLHLGPMTFTEFLKAVGQDRLAEVIAAFAWLSSGQSSSPLPPLVHQCLIRLLRLYCFVGGMPEAVQAYAESEDLRDVASVHGSILDAYRDDFPKYVARRDMTRMLRVFNFAASQGGPKVGYSKVSPEASSATIRDDVDLLEKACVIAKVTHSHCSGLPLQAGLNEKVFKLIFLDVGLMNAVCGLNWETIASQSETELANAGSGAEQFVGQHLQYLLAQRPNRELTYWLRNGRSNNAEVDYVVEFGGRIVPIEVKAGHAGRLKSLHQFVAEKQVPLAVRFNSDLPTLQTVEAEVRRGKGSERVRYPLLSLPLYLVERLPQIVEMAAEKF